MRTYIKILVIGLGIFAAIFTMASDAKEINVNNPSYTPTSTPVTVLPKIQEAVSLLKSSAPLKYETKPRSSELSRKQIALAILNTQTGEVVEKRVWVKEDEIKNYRKTGIMNLVSDKANEPLIVKAAWWNTFNSDLYIEGRPEMIIIANKYLFPSTYLGSLSERSKTKYTDIVYVPYSKALHTPEIIQAGKDYIDSIVNAGVGDLKVKKVASLSSPESLIVNTVDPDFLKTILLVEHVDPDGFTFSQDGGMKLTERVLVIVGANKERAYRYTGSPAGANGIAQFIKPTYDAMVKLYPKAGLHKDYVLGMADHVNAVKAQVLFFDAHKKEINNKVTRKETIRQIGITEEMLAAAYNGGPGRVVTSLNTYGLGWLERQLAGTAQVFRKETLTYLKKFKSIKDLNIF